MPFVLNASLFLVGNICHAAINTVKDWIASVFRGLWDNGILDNVRQQQGRKPLPVNIVYAFQTAYGIILEFRRIFGVHILEHTAIPENQHKQVFHDLQNRESLPLVGIVSECC